VRAHHHAVALSCPHQPPSSAGIEPLRVGDRVRVDAATSDGSTLVNAEIVLEDREDEPGDDSDERPDGAPDAEADDEPHDAADAAPGDESDQGGDEESDPGHGGIDDDSEDDRSPE
jgi:hypothetical protein